MNQEWSALGCSMTQLVTQMYSDVAGLNRLCFGHRCLLVQPSDLATWVEHRPQGVAWQMHRWFRMGGILFEQVLDWPAGVWCLVAELEDTASFFISVTFLLSNMEVLPSLAAHGAWIWSFLLDKSNPWSIGRNGEPHGLTYGCLVEDGCWSLRRRWWCLCCWEIRLNNHL